MSHRPLNLTSSHASVIKKINSPMLGPTKIKTTADFRNPSIYLFKNLLYEVFTFFLGTVFYGTAVRSTPLGTYFVRSVIQCIQARERWYYARLVASAYNLCRGFAPALFALKIIYLIEAFASRNENKDKIKVTFTVCTFQYNISSGE